MFVLASLTFLSFSKCLTRFLHTAIGISTKFSDRNFCCSIFNDQSGYTYQRNLTHYTGNKDVCQHFSQSFSNFFVNVIPPFGGVLSILLQGAAFVNPLFLFFSATFLGKNTPDSFLSGEKSRKGYADLYIIYKERINRRIVPSSVREWRLRRVSLPPLPE